MRSFHLLLVALVAFSSLVSARITQEQREASNAANAKIRHVPQPDFTKKIEDAAAAVSKGEAPSMALVFFGALWCQYTALLNPTWLKFQEEFEKLKLSEEYDVEIFKVECSTDEDFCRRQKVEGYPTVNLYKGGNLVEECMEDKPEGFVKYIERKTAELEKKKPEPAAAAPSKVAAPEKLQVGTEKNDAPSAEGIEVDIKSERLEESTYSTFGILSFGSFFVLVALYTVRTLRRRNSRHQALLG
ncbi:hypothetical protein BJ742DRAFT_139025 [Cladochytrium replicatum]|nr:hypothetical protein BJ742DRAFT_139025 [Cladochytrium replicatum]